MVATRRNGTSEMFSVKFAIALIFAQTLWSLPAYANPGGSKAPAKAHLEGPKFSDEEYHARLNLISFPALRKGGSPKQGRNLNFKLIIVTDEEDNIKIICQMAAAYRDALLTSFHETPVVLNRRGKPYDLPATLQRITEIIRVAVGNELVTGIRVASENVMDYAEKSVPCGK